MLSVENNTKNPKYSVQLSCNSFVNWQTQENKLKAFGFDYHGKVKYFEGSHEILSLLRQNLASKIFFKDIQDFYEPLKFLGKGGSSKVYLVQDKIRNIKLASKCIDKSYLMEDGGYQALYGEIECMLRLNHNNIIKLHEIYEGDKTFYMILDYLRGKSLSDVIHEQRKSSQFTQDQIKLILKQILQGVQHMHQNKVMHRDLKPENIMFQDQNDLNNLKIVDFGLSAKTEAESYLFSKCGTPGYVAPEIANLEDLSTNYDKVCDMFSVGAIFYKLITLKELFPGQDHDEALRLNKKCNINLTVLNLYKTPYNAIDLIKKLLEPDPKKRIQVDDALQHPYFNEILPENIKTKTQIQERKMKFQTPKDQINQENPPWKTHDFVNSKRVQQFDSTSTRDGEEFDDIDINCDNSSIPKIPVLNKRIFQMNGFAMKGVKRAHNSLNPEKLEYKKFNTNEFESSPSEKSPLSSLIPSLINIGKNDQQQKNKNVTLFLIGTIEEKQEEEQKN